MSNEENKLRLEALREMLVEEKEEKEKDVEDSAEDSEEEDEKEEKDTDGKNESFSEHLGIMFESDDLSEETKEKITSLFESAVAFEANKKAEQIQESIQAQYNQQLAEAKEELQKQADGYLTYVVEEWAKKNEVALQSQIKSNLMESFIVGLRNLFLEHNINIPEEQVDLAESLTQRVEELEGIVKDFAIRNSALSEQLDTKDRQLAFKEISEGMTELDVEKFSQLLEGKEYEDSASYRKNAMLIKESYFKQKVELEEQKPEVIAEDKHEEVDSAILEYASFLSKKFR